MKRDHKAAGPNGAGRLPRCKAADGKAQGKVKWFSRVKGYGFISPDDGGPDVFIHYSNIGGEGYRNLVEGQAVEYKLVDEGKGPKAIQVRPVRGG